MNDLHWCMHVPKWQLAVKIFSCLQICRDLTSHCFCLLVVSTSKGRFETTRLLDPKLFFFVE